MAGASMYHAALVGWSGLRIVAARDTHTEAKTYILIQHPDQRVAENLGAAFTDDHRIEQNTVEPLISDAVKAVREQVANVTGIMLTHFRVSTFDRENGEPTEPVSAIEVTLDKNAVGGYLLIITIPYDEDRYGNTYELGAWVGPKPSRTNACATCGSANPQFRCKACKTDLYCGFACQTKAWARGHDKECL